MKTTVPSNPRPSQPIGQLIAEAGGRSLTTCPNCGQERSFLATNSYHTQSMGRRRLRKCRFCGHARSETVPAPKIDGEITVTQG